MGESLLRDGGRGRPPSRLFLSSEDPMAFIHAADALAFCADLPDQSVDLLLTDPPYYGIVQNSWDNQ